MNLRRAWVVARKESMEILRDRIYFALAFLLPVVLMLVFGYGMTQEVRNVPFVIVDHDHSPLSRDYAYRFIESRYFDFLGYAKSSADADALLSNGKARVVIVVPQDFQERLTAGLPAEIQTLLDGTFTFRLRTVLGYVQAINAAASGAVQLEYLTRSAGISAARAQTLMQPVRIETRYLYNEELREIWSVAPALVMFILTLTSPILMALSVVREKETGTIYNIYASTISRAEFLLGKLAPNVLVSFLNGIVLVLMAVFYFGAPLKGNVAFLLVAMLLFVVWATSMGLLVSVLVQTQMAAIIVTVVIAMVLVMQFSGMLIPVSSMPEFNYYIAHTMAPMHFNEIVTRIFLKSGGFADSWREVATLLCLTAAFLVAGYLSFRKRSPN